MIQQTCPHCSREIRVADDYAGKKIKCPGCKEVLALPAASTAVRTGTPVPERKAAPPAPPPRRPVEEDDDDVAVITEAVDDDEGEEELERKPRKRRKRKGDWADCPNCDAPGNAKRVGFTLWGGAVGPWILSHVRCNECGTCYNGKTGKSNNVAIAIYIGVTAVISFILVGLAVIGTLVRH